MPLIAIACFRMLTIFLNAYHMQAMETSCRAYMNPYNMNKSSIHHEEKRLVMNQMLATNDANLLFFFSELC